MKATLCSTTQTATPLAASLSHDCLDGLVGLPLNPGHGLVQQQAARVVHQRAGDAHQLLLAEGEFAHRLPGDPGKPGVRKDVARAGAVRLALAPYPPGRQHRTQQAFAGIVARRNQQVIQHRQRGEQA